MNKYSFTEALSLLGISALPILVGLVLFVFAITTASDPFLGGLVGVLVGGGLVLLALGGGALAATRPWRVLGVRGIGLALAVGGMLFALIAFDGLVTAPSTTMFGLWALAASILLLGAGVVMWRPWQDTLTAPDELAAIGTIARFCLSGGLGMVALTPIVETFSADPGSSTPGTVGTLALLLGLMLRQVPQQKPEFFASLFPTAPESKALTRILIGVVVFVTACVALACFNGLRLGWTRARAVDLVGLLIVLVIQIRALIVLRVRPAG